MAQRETYERAQIELADLLARDDMGESAYQEWAERHPLVFECLGYDEPFPHPYLRTSEEELYIPDFIAQDATGNWEIVDLKRPDTRVLKDRSRRETFYAEFDDYIAQLYDYIEYFDDADHRNKFAEQAGIAVQKQPNGIVVAGRSEGLDRRKLKALRCFVWMDALVHDRLIVALGSIRGSGVNGS